MNVYLNEEGFDLNEQLLNQLTQDFEALLNMKINSLEELTLFLHKQKNLYESVDEKVLRHYITFQCDSFDEENKKRYEFDQQHVKPLYKKYQSLFDQKLLDNPLLNDLPNKVYGEFIKKLENQAALFSEANLEIEKEEDRLASRYFEIMGSLTSIWDGKEVTISELIAYRENPDREIRKKALESIFTPLLNKEDEIQEILDDLIRLRVEKAKNAGLTSFTEYMFKKYNRFDYTADDCKQFAESVREHVLPLVQQLEKEHKEELKVDVYYPWDVTGVSPDKKPLKPVESAEELVIKSSKVLGALHPEFEKLVHDMDHKKMFDLTPRKGKSQGGFCESLPETGLSFIFMNFTHTHDDLVTFMHEMGHGIHDFLKRDQELYAYKQIPMESAELASMSMEFLTMDRWTEFYDSEEDFKRAKKELIKRAVGLLPSIMTVDQFQRWLYESPEHTWKERNQMFAKLSDQFRTSVVQWKGYEDIKAKNWMYILHIFEVPFYYIEYAIAQVGALQMYKNYKENPDGTIEKYRAALELGSSKSLPEIYEEAGIKFDFSSETVADLMEFVAKELDLLSV
jgi:oligoendopeptidase F